MSEAEEKELTITDYEWTDYVLGELKEKEVYDGKPTVDGLRRIAQKLLGPITSCKSKVYQTPSPENQISSTVRVRIKIGDKIFDGCANTDEMSAPQMIGRHVVALVETRAEGRALRKALNIRVITKEEVGLDQEMIVDSNKISDVQIKALENQANVHNVNLVKVLTALYNTNDVSSLSHSQALSVFEKFSQWINDSVPKEFLND